MSLRFARVNFMTPHCESDALLDTTLPFSVVTPVQNEQEEKLKGEEAKAYYEYVIDQPSTAANGVQTVPVAPPKAKRSKSKIKSSSSEKLQINDRTKNSFLKAASEGDSTGLKDFIKKGMDLDVQDLFGWTPLMCAAFAGHQNVVSFLKSAGANLELTSKKGENAFDLAQQNGHETVMDCLEDIPEPSSNNNTISAEAQEPKFCLACNLLYSECSHKTSTVHRLSTSKVRDRPVFSIPHTNRGYDLMVKAGWDHKSGLGKEGRGRKYPVKTVLKRDRKGLGSRHEKARVTHFGAFDERAVQDVRRRDVKVKSKSQAKREAHRREMKQKRWEIDFKRSFRTE